MPNIHRSGKRSGLPNRRLFSPPAQPRRLQRAGRGRQPGSPAAQSRRSARAHREHRTAEEAYRIALEAEDEALTRLRRSKPKPTLISCASGHRNGAATRRSGHQPHRAHWAFENRPPVALPRNRPCLRADETETLRHLGRACGRRPQGLRRSRARTSAAEEENGYSKAAKQLEQAEEAVDSIFLQICAWPCASLAEVQLKATI